MNNSNAPYQSCPSEDMLQRYANGELSPEETRFVEIHLLECEMCQDYTEGLLMMQEQNIDLKNEVNEIDRLIDNKIHNKKSKVVFFKTNHLLKIAAVFLLLIGLSIILKLSVLNNPKHSILAENKIDSSMERIEPKAGDAKTENKIQQEEALIEKGDIADLSESSQQKPITIVSDYDNEESKKTELPKSAYTGSTVYNDETVSEMIETKAEGSKGIVMPAVSEEVVLDVIEDKSKDDEREVSYAAETENLSGKVVSESRHEKSKRTKLDKIPKKQAAPQVYETDETTVTSVSQWYSTKEYNRILNLSNLDENGDTNYMIVYYKALVYIQLKEFPKAKELLEQLAKQNNSYRNEAKNLLKSANFK